MSEEVKEEKQEQTSGEDVIKAFGNKEEKEPAKETVDSKTEDKQETVDPEQKSAASDSKEEKQSGKTYTQAEVDAMMAKTRKKYSKGDAIQTENSIADEVVNRESEEQQADPTTTQDLATGITVDRLAQAELKAEMAINGVDPSKVARAVRLIDINEVVENGQYSEAKAKDAIETLMKEWPELKLNKAESNDNQFYFGAPEQEEKQDKQKNMFSSIFGND